VLLLAFLSAQTWVLLRRRKKLEISLKQAREAQMDAQEISQAKTIFMAHVSHELRTPLNAIIGYSELIAEDLEGIAELALQEKIRSDLEIIKSSAYYQLVLINNLLHLTDLETKKAKLLLQEFSIQDLVNKVTEQLQVMFSIHKNQLDIFYDPPQPGTMRSDKNKLEGILVNILSNANKFTREGMITLSVTRKQEEGSENIIFAIRDTGQGIKTDHMRTLFQEFSKMVDQTQLGGVGLGLKVSKRFCQMMGGKITVHSTYGEGSTFKVSVPRSIPDSADSLKSREYPLYRPHRVTSAKIEETRGSPKT
jgi:signal transduction histidine kinase